MVLHTYELTSLSNQSALSIPAYLVLHTYELTSLSNHWADIERISNVLHTYELTSLSNNLVVSGTCFMFYIPTNLQVSQTKEASVKKENTFYIPTNLQVSQTPCHAACE